MSDPDEIRKIVLEYYSKVFNEDQFTRPSLVNIKFLKLSSIEAQQFKVPFTLDEVKSVVWSCDGAKAPGPDGFNFNFFKVAWKIICFDVLALLISFMTLG